MFFMFFMLSSYNIKTNKKFIVVLDAGHGGYDSGAIGYDNIKEKNINLDIAIVTKFLLEKYDDNVKVILTRNEDKFISLDKRTEIANYFNADLFISIHCDANNNSNAKGLGIFIIKNIKSRKYPIENYKKSLKYALGLNKILTEKLNIKSRGLQFENFQVLRQTLNKMPSILLEIGFISNKEEAEYFETKGKRGISYGLCNSILLYKKELK